MGSYINKGNGGFAEVLNGEYVDKSGLISVVNATLGTERRYSCVTRCRRFGKSMAAKMLYAYYDQSCDSRSLFCNLEISKDASFGRHLNGYPSIFVDIAKFTTKYWKDDNIVSHIQKSVISDLLEAYPDVTAAEDDNLMDVLMRIVLMTGKKFILIIDEWDAILREFCDKRLVIDMYLNMLRNMFKNADSNSVFSGVYMTGILPIKKYSTESALNNFEEYSMVDPADMAEYFGFTKSEVALLAEKYNADAEELGVWYDGYRIGRLNSICNPDSVMKAIQRGSCRNYWSGTGSYESVKMYIQMNFGGLKDDIVKMLAGQRSEVNPVTFQNDMSIINSKDDVLTLLIHLGYLAYDEEDGRCYVPNREVAEVFSSAVKETSWRKLSDTLDASRRLLESTIRGDEEAVAKGIDLAHDDNTSVLSYNDENSLSCVLAIAYYYAKNDYVFFRELPTGKGFADLVLIPKKKNQLPALVIELKFDKAADTAIDQIKQKNYPQKISEYTGDILLVGISYDKRSKTHSCRIERM